VGLGAGVLGAGAAADLADQAPVDQADHQDAEGNAQQRQGAQQVGAAPAGAVAGDQQFTLAIEQLPCLVADAGRHLQRVPVDAHLGGREAPTPVALQVGLDLPDAAVAQVAQPADPRLLLRVVADQRRQPVQQRAELFAVDLVGGQVVDVAGEQVAALRRFGITQARLEGIDVGDDFVGVGHLVGIGDEALRAQQHAHADRDEHRHRQQQSSLAGPA
jgi:hypothetical protein